MNNPYIESLYLNLSSKRNELMANFHFISSSKPQLADIGGIPEKLDLTLSSITEINSKIDILVKLFPYLKDIINDSIKEESHKDKAEEVKKEKFSPEGSSLYEDGELFREPN